MASVITKMKQKPPGIGTSSAILPVHFALKIAQCFGFFPVQGFKEGKEFPSFKWISLSMVYSALTATCSLLFVITNIYYTIRIDSGLFQLAGIVFYFSGFISSLLFIRLAKAWPDLTKSIEKVGTNLYYFKVDEKLPRRLKVIATVFLTVAAVEHTLIQIINAIQSFECDRTSSEAYQYFIVKLNFPQFFTIFPFTFGGSVLALIVNIQTTFSWTFTDLFVILICTSLTSLMSCIVKETEKKIKNKVTSEEEWRLLREDYSKICGLLRVISSRIEDFVILSLATSQFFILIQMFKSLVIDPSSHFEKGYLSVSLFLLIARIICVCIYGAYLFEENRKLLPLLHSAIPSAFNSEVRRFANEVSYNKVALSGRGFFSINRNLILNIAGAVVTYELVIIQFNTELLEHGLPSALNRTCMNFNHQ